MPTAQLFQTFAGFQRRSAHGGVLLQKACAVGIDADVAQRRGHRQPEIARLHDVARIGDGGAAEIERVVRLAEHHFHAVGVLEFGKIVHGMGGGCHRRVAVGKLLGNAVNQRAGNHRFVALHVHDDFVFRQPQDLHGFGKAGAAALVRAVGEDAVDAVRGAGSLNVGVVGGDNHAAGGALPGAFGNADHHRLAVDVG